MGKRPPRFTWPEAKKRCRINQLDIEIAKRLGFGPDALVHAIPSPQQKWKLPVKQWVRELHFKKFGHVLGEQVMDVPRSGARASARHVPEHVEAEDERPLF